MPRFPATISPIDVQQLGNGFAAYSGYWNIDFETTEGAQIEGFAKFTFVFERQSGGDLRIVLLNSGLTPTGLVVIEEAPAPALDDESVEAPVEGQEPEEVGEVEETPAPILETGVDVLSTDVVEEAEVEEEP